MFAILQVVANFIIGIVIIMVAELLVTEVKRRLAVHGLADLSYNKEG